MVVLSEIGNMFWGVTLDVGKKYSQTVERGFHISMAALEPLQNKDEEGPVSVMIEHNKNNFMLCTLQHGRIFQQPLDLNFNEGEELILFLKGKGTVHLTGYLHIDDEDDDMDMTMGTDDMESSDEADSSDADSSLDEEDDELIAESKKRKKILPKPSDSDSKKRKVEIVDKNNVDDEEEEKSSGDEDSEDDDDKSDSFLYKKSEKSDKKKSKTEDVEKTKTEESTPKAKSSKPAAATPQTPATPQTDASSGGEESSKKKKKKKKKKKNKHEEGGATPTDASKDSTTSKEANKTPSGKSKRVGEGGVIIEELKEGHGPEVKPGKHAHVYYTGRLQNGKIFDTKVSGSTFKFKYGKKEVISGWDVGLAGMKVGGKRKLIIPPKMAYGSQQAGAVPPNSTLTFEIELKAIS